MAVPEQTPYIEHTGNGVTTSFSLGFQCESKDHLIVLVDEIEPPIATWSLTGGNVVFTTAPAAGQKITLQRNTPFGRTTNYQSFNNSFRPQAVNSDFDRVWLKLQELGVADWLLKLYVDRKDSELQQNIENLKVYVDDKDDELRAYLLEEIRKQGVALDQLDEYYNYLMQRLAQIAVDKGWEASFVVDASGKSQQEINDAQKLKNLERVSVKDYGAIGDGTLHTLQEWVDSGKFSNLTAIQMVYEFAKSLTDSIDYVACAQAIKFANTKMRTGLVSTIKNSGACVRLPTGVYNMQGITQAFPVMCNIKNDGAGFVIPSDYAGTVFNVGSFTAVENLAKADIELPDVYKTVSNNPLLTGSCGVRVGNLNASRLVLGRISYFESGLWLGGIGEGTVYNDIYLSQINYCKRLINITPGAGGWCNANRIYGGNLHQSTGFAGGIRSPGWSFLFVDGRAPATAVVGNNFFGTSFEGNAADYAFDFYGAYGNSLIGCYHETGAPFNPVTVSGDTLTHTGHTLVVGDQIAFIASTLPTGMLDNSKYYVVSAIGDTFKVSKNRAGAAEVFASSGSNVRYILSARFRFNQPAGGALCSDNKIINVFAPPSIFLDIIQTGQAQNNGIESPSAKIVETYNLNNAPLYRSRNTSSGLNRPIYAAYKSDIKVTENPDLWSAALTSEGMAFRENGTDLAYLSNSAGVLKYKRPSDARAYDIATCTRTVSLQSISEFSVPAKGRGIALINLTGVVPGELVTVTPYSALVDGIAIAWARVSEADKVQVCFHNWTDAAISLSAQLHVMATRNYH